MQEIIRIEQGVARMPEWRMAQPIDFSLCDGEHLAIVGPNGGGKSMLVAMLTGRHPLIGQAPAYDFSPNEGAMVSENIRHVTFRDTYGGDNDRTYFLQQRWNQLEIDASTPTVGDLLEEAYRLSGDDTPERRALKLRLIQLFQLEPLLDKYVILLSSGELRRLKLSSALLGNPRVLILESPFIGLDRETRARLSSLLGMLAKEQALQIVLVLGTGDEIPAFVTHIVEVDHCICGPKLPRETFLAQQKPLPQSVLGEERRQAILNLPQREETDTPLAGGESESEVIHMQQVTIRYGRRTILKELDWTVKRGERWSLSGPNGAGKSTLLSLVCADNPQAYACDIALFGHRRGRGESIWDIKRRIGYVSPEMHRSYHRDIAAIKIVASGLHDTVGLYVKPSEGDYAKCRFWMGIFGLQGLEERSFLKLSSGEQRLVLLARAFVKDPELLILDEPLHGLDASNRQLAREVIETFCQREGKTLVMVTHYPEELPPCVDHHLQLTPHSSTPA